MNTSTLDKSPLAEQLLGAFDHVSKQNAVLTAVRLEALARFENLGFPTIKNEEWKYTNLKSLSQQQFFLNAPSQLTQTQLSEMYVADTEATALVFVNGVYKAELSHIAPQAAGIVVTTFGQALEQYPQEVEKYFAQFADYQKDGITALNTAFAQEGLFVYVPEKQVVEHPVYLYHISDSQEVAPMAHLRTLIVAGKSSQSTFVNLFLSKGSHKSFVTAVAEISIAENASVNYYTLQNESEHASHIATTQAHIARDGHFRAHTYSLRGALVRNNLNMVLAGSNIEAHMYGLYLLNGTTHVDNHTLADHQQPHSYSNELYKGILDGKSTGVFNGKIYVKPDAQKTNAFQSNRNLVISKEASMNTKPQLEIFADDVKCSHGATVGQLDEEMLFYLRSRGIGFESARALLMRAFADDVLQNIEIEPLKEYVDHLIETRF